jgi:hypothetical protein
MRICLYMPLAHLISQRQVPRSMFVPLPLSGPRWAQTWAPTGPMKGPNMGPPWAQNWPRIYPELAPNGPQWTPKGAESDPNRHKMSPCPRWTQKEPMGGPKVSAEPTLIADSPRPTFMAKANEKAQCLLYMILNLCRNIMKPFCFD